LTIGHFGPRFPEYKIMAGRFPFGRLDAENNHDDDE